MGHENISHAGVIYYDAIVTDVFCRLFLTETWLAALAASSPRRSGSLRSSGDKLLLSRTSGPTSSKAIELLSALNPTALYNSPVSWIGVWPGRDSNDVSLLLLIGRLSIAVERARAFKTTDKMCKVEGGRDRLGQRSLATGGAPVDGNDCPLGCMVINIMRVRCSALITTGRCPYPVPIADLKPWCCTIGGGMIERQVGGIRTPYYRPRPS